VAIVFGAGLNRDGTPTAVLKDRVSTAAALYQAGKVQVLLMSGDNRTETYNEPASMANYAIQLGIPESVIVLDYAGHRTYDTCFRAREIFGVRDALLVTQRFHLPRAVFTCNMLGIDAEGVVADRRSYWSPAQRYWGIREIPATLVALWDVWVRRPTPILGEPEPIFSSESSISLDPIGGDPP
jgi:SanA protein